MSEVVAPTKDCLRCGFTLSVFEFSAKGPASRVCRDCRRIAAQAWRVAGITTRHCLTVHAVDALLRLGYVNAARRILAGGSWPTLREARLLQIPKQRRPA